MMMHAVLIPGKEGDVLIDPRFFTELCEVFAMCQYPTLIYTAVETV